MNLIVELIKSALYGLVEGITEWLPISSTGHMLLVNKVMPLAVSKDFWDMFLVVIQLGAILAVCVLYFHQLNPLSSRKSKIERADTWQLWAKIVVACLPAALIGIPLDNWMEEHLGSPWIIALALIVYGVAFIVIERRREMRASDLLRSGVVRKSRGRHLAVPDPMSYTQAELADMDAKVTDTSELPWSVALGIGLFQILSLVPGTSRSGSTIIGALLLGCSRAVAAEFTFYLAIPVMFGASALRLLKFFLKGNAFTSAELAILGVGCVVAFVVSVAAIRFLTGFVKKHDFKPFGVYRIVLGVVVLAAALLIL